MSHINDPAEQMGVGEGDLTECKFCGRVICTGRCGGARQHERELLDGQMGVGEGDSAGRHEPTVADVVTWINDVENQEPMPPEQEAAYDEAVAGIASILRTDAGTVAGTRIHGRLSLETALMIAVDIGWHAATAALVAHARLAARPATGEGES